MKLIIRGRCRGKTTEAVRLAAESGAYIVCGDRRRATQVFRDAHDAGIDINFPLTAREFFSGEFRGKGIQGFIFDDLDKILRDYAHGVPLLAASWDAGNLELG